MIDVVVTGFAAFTPSGPDDKPDLGLLDRTLRRGLSDVTRLFMHAAQGALDHAGVSARDVHILFGSAFGEIATAEAMLAQAYDENDASPARFRNSVHNTAPGLLSIGVRNTLPSQSISAGFDTVAIGLLEASMLLRDGAERVLLVFAEEPVPSDLSLEFRYGKLAAAFVLMRPEHATVHHGRLRNLRRTEAPAPPRTPEQHPLAAALALVRALLEGQEATLVVGDGEPRYLVDLVPGATP